MHMTEKLNILKRLRVAVMLLLLHTTSRHTGHDLKFKWQHYYILAKSWSLQDKGDSTNKGIEITLNDNVSSESFITLHLVYAIFFSASAFVIVN